MHYDRGSDENGVPQLTIGASFGATRELTLMHVKSGVTMCHGQVMVGGVGVMVMFVEFIMIYGLVVIYSDFGV